MRYAVFAIFLVLFISSCAPQEEDPLTIGAVLVLTGPAATWGESMQNGMEFARKDLESRGIDIRIVYEDSQLDASAGIAAYTKLKNVDGADVIFSQISRVSMPLLPLANADRIPLFLTAVSAADVTESKYVFRYFLTPDQYVEPHFKSMPPYQTSALLYVNDEYGVSTAASVRRHAKEKGIDIVVEEKFDPQSTDFRTSLAKIKEWDPEAIFYIGEPAGTVSALKQKEELGVDAEIYEMSSTMLQDSLQRAAGAAAEGLHTIGTPAALRQNAPEFWDRYEEEFGTSPFFPALFGYDMVMLVANATGGTAMSGEEIVAAMLAIQEFNGLNGQIPIQENGEMNPPAFSVTIADGELTQGQAEGALHPT